jgi:hypothetical protein
MNDAFRLTKLTCHHFAVGMFATICLFMHLQSTSVRADDAFLPHDGSVHVDARHARAGNPLSIAPWARLTYGPNYRGYYIGGGTPATRLKYLPPVYWRFLSEGTWGMDFAPDWTNVALLWTHGRRRQGGAGQYEPDRPNWPFGLDKTRP